MIRVWCLALFTLVVGAAGPTRALSPDEVAERLRAGHQALDNWQLDEAAAIAQELERTLPDVPPVQALIGEVKFHTGDYEGAVRLLERAAEGGAPPRLLPLAKSTRDETRGAVAHESDHFVFRTPPGKDELLAPIALEALEQAYANIGDAFDYRPERKIVVDVLQDPKGLARVSSLTVDEIQTSGTIALCKYNRLMITSPKALLRGYAWLDTLAHEFVHLVVSEKSKNTVPIWLHEGLAKFSESLWRGPPGQALTPSSERLLADAVKRNKLITFRQMHPSMAKLPSQKDTALAFAEVFTVIEYIHGHRVTKAQQTTGFRTTNALLSALATGATLDRALKTTLGVRLQGLQRKWRRYLKKRKFRIVAGAKPEKLKFVRNPRKGHRASDDDEDKAALDETIDRGARKFVRLGNILRRRARLRAASVEYEKALKKMKVPAVAVVNRLAGSYLTLGELAKAKTWLDKNEVMAPDDAQTRILLGRVAFLSKDFAAARAHYERAAWRNPFNPEIHAALHEVGKATGDTALQKRAADALAKLSAHARAHPAADSVLAKGDAPFGVLNIRSDPWGEVFIDGLSVGASTPLLDLRLKPGLHRVRVHARSSGAQAMREVTIVEGQAQSITLSPRPVDPEILEGWVRKEREGHQAPALAAPDGGAP